MPSPSFATAGSISAVHSDVTKTHILTRLDGATLASLSSVSSQLNSPITADETLWTYIHHSTWAPTNTPRLLHVISSFVINGPCCFFSDSFTIPDNVANGELISAVDIDQAYKQQGYEH
ncbi:hypothetical protein AB3S75_015699 [Citrus x aurantiifolia]